MNEMQKIFEKVINGYQVSFLEAEQLYKEEDIYLLLYFANKIREKYFGKKIKFCSIVNAKSGKCSEDCKFCAQSAFYKTEIKKYPLIKSEDILKSAKESKKNGACGFSIVISGRGIKSKQELEEICYAINKISKMGLYSCASLGEIDYETAKLLKQSGLKRYHHNLETSKRLFEKICSTHSYESKFNTLKAVIKAKLEVCSGGLFGIGEDYKDRLELAFTLKRFKVQSIPINFLNPIKGTPLYNQSSLTPFEILRIIAVYRFIFPDKDIKVCGGREKNLRDLQSWIYYAGANGSMLGNYLTTIGRPVKEDLQMISDLEMEIEKK